MDDLWIRYIQKGRKGLKYLRKRRDSDCQVKILTATAIFKFNVGNKIWINYYYCI